jgi:hypothetical protein
MKINERLRLEEEKMKLANHEGGISDPDGESAEHTTTTTTTKLNTSTTSTASSGPEDGEHDKTIERIINQVAGMVDTFVVLIFYFIFSG